MYGRKLDEIQAADDLAWSDNLTDRLEEDHGLDPLQVEKAIKLMSIGVSEEGAAAQVKIK